MKRKTDKLTKISLVNKLMEKFKDSKIPRHLMTQIVTECANEVMEALNSGRIVVFPRTITLRPTTRIIEVSTPEGIISREMTRSVDLRVEREFSNFLTRSCQNGDDDYQTSANPP